MSKKKPRRGRPEVDSTAVTVRMLNTEIAQVDAWAGRHMADASRPKAIRRLVALGLVGSKPVGKRRQKDTAKATKMAGREIDRVADSSATSIERAKRKRRILKGPTEFRDIRKN